MEGTWLRKGHGYGGDKGMLGKMVWMGHGYGRDMAMDGTRV